MPVRALIVLIPIFVLPVDAAARDGWLNSEAVKEGINILDAVKERRGPARLTLGEIGEALKEALCVGSEDVVKRLGRTDGFNADIAVHIPLPPELRKVKKTLTKLGFSSLVDNLELKLNRAAEAAAPRARKLFVQAIAEMTFADIRGIYEGPDDAATRYFQEKMTSSLQAEMQPIVDDSLSQVGAIRAYDKVMGRYQSLPFVRDVKADLTKHVLERTTAGIFHYLAQAEAAIRKDPLRQTTDLLKRAFGRG